MKKLIAAIISVALAASCIPKAETEAALARLEARLADAPDSVLTALSEMERPAFLPRSIKAEYALLYSEALDKNGILMRSDSIIAPAVRYFDFHGTPDQKLKTFYYRGLISENDGLPEDAMEWLKKAETNLTPTSPPSLAGRLYSHKSTLYYNAYDYEDALLNNKLAAGWFEKGGDYQDLAYRLTAIANNLACLQDSLAANEMLSHVIDYWAYIDQDCQENYYCNKLLLAFQSNNQSKTLEILSNCRRAIPNYDNNPVLNLIAIEAFASCHLVDSCSSLLAKYEKIEGLGEKPANYYLTLSHYYEEKGDYRKAYSALEEYLTRDGDETIKVLKADTKYIEERYESKLRDEKEKNTTTIFSVLSLSLLLALVFVFRYLQKKLSISQRNYREVKEEWNTLTTIKNQNTIIDSKSMESINNRLRLLDQVILGHISENPLLSKKANIEIQQLIKNKDSFIIDTASVFSASRPRFSSWLSSFGLNEREIGFCSLLIIGMYGKDSRPYFSKYESESLTNSIRNKLGLSHNGQKLRIYLQDQFSKIENV